MKKNLSEILSFDGIRGMDKQKVILALVVCLLLVYVDFTFVIRAQFRGIKTMGPKIAKLHKDIDTLNRELASLKTTAPAQAEMKKREELARSKKLITEDEIPLLLEEISDISNTNGVKIVQMRPAKDPRAKEELVLGVRVFPVTVALDLLCGYHTFGSFMAAVENSTRFMAVQELKITNDPADYMNHRVSLVFKTYVRK